MTDCVTYRNGAFEFPAALLREPADPHYIAAMRPMTPGFFVALWARHADRPAIMRAAISFFVR